MNHQHFVLFFLLAIINIRPAFAQTDKLRFEHLTINNGLSQNDVWNIMQDSKGYLWFATLDGLNKYDGYQFTTYQHDPHKKNSLTQNVVAGIWQNTDGTLWVHPANGDLQKFNPATEAFTVFNPVSSSGIRYVPNFILYLEEDVEGMMWVLNDRGQLCRFNKTDGRIQGNDYSTVILNNPVNKATANKKANYLYKDKKGNIWIGSTEGLHKLKLTSGAKGQPSVISFNNYWYNPKDSNSMMQVGRIFEDHTGKFWLGRNEILGCYDTNMNQIAKYNLRESDFNPADNDRTNGIAEDAEGNLWIATYNGLKRIDKERKSLMRFFHDPSDPFSLSSNQLLSIIIDKSNTMWLGTLKEGVNKVNLNSSSFLLYQYNPFDTNSLSNNKVSSICGDKEGIVWIGTAGGGLNAWDRATGKFFRYKHHSANPSSLYSDHIGAILEDRDGNLWIGSGNNNGIVVVSAFNRKRNNFEHHYLKYPIANIYATVFTMYQDRAGLIWIGTVNGIVTFDPATNQSRHYPRKRDDPYGLTDGWVFSFCEDRRGNMWVGTCTGNLSRLDKKTGRYKHYVNNPKDTHSIISNAARYIYEDSRGILWIGLFGGGLSRFNPDNESFTAFTSKEGLPNNTIHSIQEDNEGNLWLGTGKGLSMFSLKDYSFINYDYNDGLQSNQFSESQSPGASFKGKDGMLYFGGINGFNAFYPKDLKRSQYIPPIVINQFTLLDKPLQGLNIAKEIRLKYNENIFSFEFATLDYANSQKNQYAYKLDGIDNDWVYCGTNRIARYAGVPDGRYTFHVKGTNSDGIWNEKGISVQITILTPWWKTWWFYCLCAIAAAAIIYILFRYRLKQKLRLFAVRSRLHRDLHDDVGATLSSVKAYSEILKDNPDNPLIAELIRDNSTEMIERLEVIAWATNPQHDNFKSLKSRMIKFAAPLCHSKNIQCTIESNGVNEEMQMPGEVRQNIFLVFKEAVNNMIKYAEATDYKLNMSVQDSQFILKMADNGKGSDGTIKGSGEGWKNMKKRTEQLNGRLIIDTAPGKGTIITMALPYPFKIPSSWDTKKNVD